MQNEAIGPRSTCLQHTQAEQDAQLNSGQSPTLLGRGAGLQGQGQCEGERGMGHSRMVTINKPVALEIEHSLFLSARRNYCELFPFCSPLGKRLMASMPGNV